MQHPPICPDCDRPGRKLTGDEVYPTVPRVRYATFWVCFECDTIAACKQGTSIPKHKMANAAERERRKNWWITKQQNSAKNPSRDKTQT